MGALAIVSLVAEIVKEGAVLISTAVQASQEEIAALTVRAQNALNELRGTRREVERNIDERHEAARKALEPADPARAHVAKTVVDGE